MCGGGGGGSKKPTSPQRKIGGPVLVHTPNSKRLSSDLLRCALRIVAYPDRKTPWK